MISRSYCLMPAGPQVLELMRRFIDQSLADRFGETYGFIAPKPAPGSEASLAAPALPGLMNCVLCDGDGGGNHGRGGGGGGPVYDGGSMGTIVVTVPRYHGPREEVPPLDDVPPPPDFSDEDVFGDNRSHWGHGGRGGGSSSNNNPGDNSNRNEDNCRGSAVAVTPISSVMTPDGEGSPYAGPSNPRDPCEDGPEEEKEEEKNNIEIDPSDLKNHPKANCVYSKLNNSGTFKGVISKFAGENTNFDLKIEMTDLGSDRDDANASLNSSSSSHTFTMQINSQKIDRTPIEITGTFLHEAIHAEMRRYVYGATNTSSLSGFPGDFSADYEALVNEYYDGNPQIADHEIMAGRYISTIADGLKEMDGNLTREQYEGIAWIGLQETDYYTKLLEGNKRTEIERDIKFVKNNADDKCR